MKKNFLFSSIPLVFFPCGAFYAAEVHQNEDFPQNDGDQSIFNEENDRDNSDDDTVNLFQFSMDSVQQLLNDNMLVLDVVKKFIISIFRGYSDFVSAEFMDQYVCCKKIQYLSLKELQKYDHAFEFVDCFIDFEKVNNTKTVESTRTLFFVKSLINEYLSLSNEKRFNFKSRFIVDKNLMNKVFSNQKSRQRLNKFIKDSYGIKKNFDFCQYVNFVVLDYKNTFSVESLERLFGKYKFFEEVKNFEKLQNMFSNFVQELRSLDVENDEFQSSLDVICQGITKNPQLLRNFLISLVDKPICNLNNSDIENFLQNKFQK